MSIGNELDKLFAEWKKQLGTCFTSDGVMYQNGKTNEQVEQEWMALPKRVVFLLKDQHQFGDGENWNEDINLWLKDVDWKDTESRKKWNASAAANRNIQSKFFKNIAYILWGLVKADRNNEWWYQDVEKYHEDVRDLFNTQPFALVECKKDPGGPVCKDPILRQHIRQYGGLLKKEIEILNPNMIVCTSGIIYDFVLKMYPEKELVSIENHNSIRFHPNSGTLIFCSYHPSSRKSPEMVYEGVMWHYREFLKTEYGAQFLKSVE